MPLLASKEILVLRALYNDGLTPSGVCRYLVQGGKAQNVNDLLEAFIEAFGVMQADVSCLGGWWVDGSGELSDRAIDGFVAPAIERARQGWE